MRLINKFREKLENSGKSLGFFLGTLVGLQVLSLYLVNVSVLPTWTIWVHLFLLSAVFFVVSARTAVLLFILSIPFFTVLPNRSFETLNLWRPLLLLLFARVVGLDVVYRICRTGLRKFCADLIIYLKQSYFRLLKWEKIAILFFVWSCFTLLWADFPSEGLKQLLFIFNAFLLYPIVRNAGSRGRQVGGVSSEEQSASESASQLGEFNVLKYLCISTGLVVFLGFLQLIASVIFEFYYFWQFWATQIASVYFGSSFANVSAYSNSWLGADLNTLRMFSVMPSSHGFAVVCVLFIGSLIGFYARQGITLRKRHYFLLGVASLGIVLSGTRGVWVGMIPVLVVTLVLWYKRFFVEALRPLAVSMLLVLVFIVISPFVNMGLAQMRAGFSGDSFKRVISIVDFDEASNAGRLYIWKESLKYYVKHPQGTGFDNFITTLSPHITSLPDFANERNKGYNLPQKYITAHNLYLQILVETSIVGLILFVLMWGYFLKSTWLFVKREELRVKSEKFFSHSSLLALPFALVLLWLLAYSFFDLTLLNDKILLYMFVCLAIVRVSLTNQQKNGRRRTNSSRGNGV